MRPDMVDGSRSGSKSWSWLWLLSIVGCCFNCLLHLLANRRRCIYVVDVVVDLVVDVAKTLGSRGGTDNFPTGTSFGFWDQSIQRKHGVVSMVVVRCCCRCVYMYRHCRRRRRQRVADERPLPAD